ncbi:hypothetical protein FNF27_03782 [Cafeteria roenbergensis]|uniref:Uncharacterized protein n=1 Tax=Cafeteria roenbergensis TaxID=33653 RepID=A0A5A8EAS5_CAFRO|nr:hypothetical protein FNF27_03782 [Cafeteria roenbergensis]
MAGLGFLPHHDGAEHPPALDVSLAYMLLPRGLGVQARSRRAALRCAGGANSSLELSRLPWPARGTGRNAWVFPRRLDAGMVSAALLNIPRDTTGDVVALVMDVELERGDAPEEDWELEAACGPAAADAALAAEIMMQVADPQACVVELLPPAGAEAGAGTEAVCSLVRGHAGSSGAPSSAPLAKAAHGTVTSAFRGSAGALSPDWDRVELEDSSRTLLDAGSLDHAGHSDPRAAAHARLTAAEVAHDRCVRRSRRPAEQDFARLHGAGVIDGVAEPMAWRPGRASVWGEGAPVCADDAAGEAGEAPVLQGGDVPAAVKDASFLQAGAESRAGALAGVRQRLEAGIPGLDIMLGPIMDSVLGPVTQIIGGVVGDVVGAGLMNLVGQGTDSALTSEVSKILTADLVGALSDQLVPPTGEAVASAVTAATTAHIRQLVPSSVGTTLADDITKRLVPRLAPALAERISERVADSVAEPLSGTLQHILTRSITAATVPALAHSLSHSPSADYFCFLCREKKLYCSYCKAAQYPATLAHAQYYAAYYGAYYAEWGAQPRAMRSGKAAENAAAMAAKQSEAVRVSQSEYMAAKKPE